VSVGAFGQIVTVPPSNNQLTTETIPWAIDLTNAIGGGSLQPSPSCTLTDITQSRAVDVPLEDAATVAGKVVTQIVRGSVLAAGHIYRLVLTFGAGGVTVQSVVMVLNCPL
jgi:hypothetical protein